MWTSESGSSPGRTMSDDKIAVTMAMRYPAGGITEKEKEKATENKMTWVKATRNYFISRQAK